LVGIHTAFMVALHFRRTIERVPIDELIVTRLSAGEIAHGLAARPLGLQATAIAAEALLHAALAIAAVGFGTYATPGDRTTAIFVMITYATVGGFYRCSLSTNANEIAASFALRAHLFLRPAATANARMMLDWI